MWTLTLEIKARYMQIPFKYKKLSDAVEFVEEIMEKHAGEDELVFHIEKDKKGE